MCLRKLEERTNARFGSMDFKDGLGCGGSGVPNGCGCICGDADYGAGGREEREGRKRLVGAARPRQRQ